MADTKMIRLSQVTRELNVGISTIVEQLASKGINLESAKPTSKISHAQFLMLAKELEVELPEKYLKKESSQPKKQEEVKAETKKVEEPKKKKEPELISAKPEGLKVVGKIDLDKQKKSTSTKPKVSEKKQTKLVKNKVEEKSIQAEKKVDNKKKESVDKDKKEDKVKNVSVSKTTKKETISEEKKQTTTKVNTSTSKQENTTSQEKKSDSVNKNTESKTKQNIQEQKNTEVEEQKQSEKIRQQTNISKEKGEKPKTEIKEEIDKKDNSQSQKKENKEEKTNKTIETKIEDTTVKKETAEKVELIKAKAETLKGLTVKGKIELPTEKPKKKKKPGQTSQENAEDKPKRKRKKRRIRKEVSKDREGQSNNNNNNQNRNNNNNQNRNNNNNNQNRNNNNNQNRNNNNNNQNRNNNNNQNRNNNNQNRSNNNQNRNNNNQNRNNNNQNRNKPNDYRNRNNRRGNNRTGNNKKTSPEISEKQIQDQIKATLAKLTSGGNRGGKKSRAEARKQKQAEQVEQVEQQKILKVTEFISVNDLASVIDVSVNEMISTCMNLGMFVSINQRLDAEAIRYIALEFEYDEVEFITATEDDEAVLIEEEDKAEDLEERPPIVTIMGHVDHGKTSLLDYIRNANVTSQESGGITQHIGAYDVKTESGKKITFLDTPGHEAFTAMRARGAKVTDIVILVVAADDSVMPQTKEAINHAKQAEVPIVIAINKVDKPQANPDKIKGELSEAGVMVESWGGNYQSQEVSAKTGQGIDDLLELVLLEAEVLELKANPDKAANGTVVEASLDKGKGYVTNILVQAGTLKVGDIMLAGSYYGRVKAMVDHRGQNIKKAPPSKPVQVLGLNGAPQAGDVLKIMKNEREAREIATKRSQIMREQNIRATKGLTLEEIGRRKALNDFQILKLIVKGDVDGSVEALSDSLLRLATEEIDVEIIHKGVGGISEADIHLATTAQDTIVIGFQVRPFAGAKKLAEQNDVEIRLYSVIYDAINEVRDAMEGMLAPELKEEIVGNVTVRQTFKISKIGTVAGCYVTDGFINRNNKIRVIRDGIVTYEGEIGALKRFKDDVTEVKSGFECGLSIKSFNDLKEGDVIESFVHKEVKRTL